MAWENATLGDISSLITKGTTPTSIGFKFIETGINFIKVESIDLNGNFISSKFASISDQCHESLKRSKLEEGDILFSIAGALGRTALVTDEILPANTNQAIAIIRLKKNVPITNNFVILALTSGLTTEQIGKNQGGVAQQNLSLGQLKTFEIPLPPLETQARIVSILDSAFADIERARANAEKNLKNARELFDSYLNKVFSQRGEGWKETTLGESCEFSNGKAHEKSIDENGVFIVVNSKFISQAGAVVKRTNELKHPLNIGDIAMVMSDVPNGKALAKCFIVPEENKYSLNQRICSIKSDLFFTQFLYYQLNRNPFLLAFDNKGSQANLRKDEILSCPLWLPSIEKQQEISSKLDSLMNHTDSLLDAYNNKLASLDELKQSLLQKAFSGELTKEDEGIAA